MPQETLDDSFWDGGSPAKGEVQKYEGIEDRSVLCVIKYGCVIVCDVPSPNVEYSHNHTHTCSDEEVTKNTMVADDASDIEIENGLVFELINTQHTLNPHTILTPQNPRSQILVRQ